mgnify:FL=1
MKACAEQKTYPFNIPDGIPSFREPSYNKVSKAGFELGRKLFYDPILSGNNKVSCATCHVQSLAFADGKSLRTSDVSGVELGRTVPTLINIAWADGLFWDGGVPNLEFLMQAPIEHPDEMNQNLMELEKELNDHALYPMLFKEAFGTDTVAFPDVSNALSQFVRALLSFNSPYDAFIKEGPTALNAQEKTGYDVYKKNCASCHSEGLFTDNDYHNNGIDSVYDFDTLLGMYKGRFRITLDSADFGLYKTPTLRNIALSAPYMHDGRFATLEEVLDHYEKGVKGSNTLDARLRGKEGKNGIQFEKGEKEALLAFLKSLTDQAFVTNEAFSNPNN